MDDAHCPICFEVASQPRMCPKCSKIFCSQCISNVYQDPTGQVGYRPCPHCRACQNLENYNKVDFVEKLARDLGKKEKELELMNEKMLELAKRNAVAEMPCPTHANEEKVFYCSQRQTTMCRICRCDCGQTHVNIEDAHEYADQLWSSVNWAGRREDLEAACQLEAERKIAQVRQEMREEIEAKMKTFNLASTWLLNRMADSWPNIDEVNTEAARVRYSNRPKRCISPSCVSSIYGPIFRSFYRPSNGNP